VEINYDELNKINKKIKDYPKSSLLIVTKNRPQNLVKSLIDKGYLLFGENKVQEAESKYYNLINNKNLKLHLIGPLQTNKVKTALSLFDTIQTIDRPKLIKEISKQIKLNKNLKTKNYFIQVNIGEESQKSGIVPSETKNLYELALSENLNVTGLMCIPPISHNPSIYFKKMNELRQFIDPKFKISMGMSNDYETALINHSDLIRIGSRIFL
tara:strand:+ start:8223 stop:8858 length:636 start_codon:yes stop_codon:yes gene_type:complete